MAWHKINQDEKQRVKHQARCNLRKSDRTKDCTHSFLGKRKLSKSKKSWSETQEQLQIHDGGEGVGVFITKTIFSPPVIANSVCMLSKFLHQQCQNDNSLQMTFPCEAQKQDNWQPLSLWKPLNTHLAFLIQQIQNSHFGLYEVDARLIVIEINQGPWYLFLHIFFLFQLKDMLQGKRKTVFCEIKCRINTLNSQLNSSWHINPGCQVTHWFNWINSLTSVWKIN